MTGALVQTLKGRFDAGVKSRGRGYFQSGFVQLLTRSRVKLTARVMGSRMYHVTLELDRGVLYTGCDCPYTARHDELCKHVWATVLAADDIGSLQDVVLNGARLRVQPTTDGLDDEDFDDDGIDDDLDEGRGEDPAAREPQRSFHWHSIAAEFEPASLGPEAELHYCFDPESTRVDQLFRVLVFVRRRGVSGWGSLVRLNLPVSSLCCADPTDRWVLHLLQHDYMGYGSEATLTVPSALADDLMARLAATGRLRAGVGGRSREALAALANQPGLDWDPGEPWRLVLVLGDDLHLRGKLARSGEERDLREAELVHPSGLVLWGRTLSRLDRSAGFKWMTPLAQGATLPIPHDEVVRFVRTLAVSERAPELRLPERLGFRELREPPRPILELGPPAVGAGSEAQVFFEYAGSRVPWDAPGSRLCTDERVIVQRDREREAAWVATLPELGFRASGPRHLLSDRRLPGAIDGLLAAGWQVFAEKKPLRSAGALRISVSSGVNWFGVEGQASFNGSDAPLPLPELLRAVRAKQRMVRLGDGSVGVLPEEWLERWGVTALLAPSGDGATADAPLRIPRVQIGLLSLFSAGASEFTVDAGVERLRSALASFDGIRPCRPPRAFRGTLRGYQESGLGWLRFLEQHSFGACLADDMGLGKTVQVLALLALRRGGPRSRAPGRPPALVVVPKTLIENWLREAKRFVPWLSVKVHHGVERGEPEQTFSGHDLVLTTYGTLRRDIASISGLELDSVVLDEAQAIKNASSETAKAVRLLRAPHRVALSGTPLENHMGELWSLFEFLNPGLFSGNVALRAAFGGSKGRNARSDLSVGSAALRELVRRVVRPFILRRTKAEVAPELPTRTEQTVWVELAPGERKEYDALRGFFKQELAKSKHRPSARQAARSMPHVLTALLRLRQASCHLGLLDDTRRQAPSAKLDLLLDQLREVVDEGHKALVFSQFTSLLAIARERLERAGIPYEYLDGATRDRHAKVDRFQSEGGPPVFLMSLKAGGVGLNLTAADYVFLLDPWWNPAAEAQAIDRAHRIGQSRPVVAYRLIARDTVEERVAELQDKKRELVSAVLGGNGALGAQLTREDLEALLE